MVWQAEASLSSDWRCQRWRSSALRAVAPAGGAPRWRSGARLSFAPRPVCAATALADAGGECSSSSPTRERTGRQLPPGPCRLTTVHPQGCEPACVACVQRRGGHRAADGNSNAGGRARAAAAAERRNRAPSDPHDILGGCRSLGAAGQRRRRGGEQQAQRRPGAGSAPVRGEASGRRHQAAGEARSSCVRARHGDGHTQTCARHDPRRHVACTDGVGSAARNMCTLGSTWGVVAGSMSSRGRCGDGPAVRVPPPRRAPRRPATPRRPTRRRRRRRRAPARWQRRCARPRAPARHCSASRYGACLPPSFMLSLPLCPQQC